MGPRRFAQRVFYRAIGRMPPALPVHPAPIDHRLDHILQRTARDIGRHASPPRLQVEVTDRLLHAWDAVYRRDGEGYILELSDILGLDTFDKAAFLGPTYLYWLMHSRPEIEHVSITLSDGDRPGAALYAPSTCLPDQVALPDPYFFLNDGFRWAARHAEENDVSWSGRSGEVVWRGMSSGPGLFEPAAALATPQLMAQRLALCVAAKGMPGVDIALSDYNRPDFRADLLPTYGLLRPPVEERSWIGRKFAVDVDGWSNTWSNLIVRMHFGCCVLKVASRQGFRQWYYDRLRPWEHYVPVAADLSDLAERIDWVRSNDAEASRIGANARHLARSLTFEAARTEAAALIAANYQRDNPYVPRPLPAVTP
jgi:hypothetical protein